MVVITNVIYKLQGLFSFYKLDYLLFSPRETYLMTNLVFYSHIKYVEIDFHFIHDRVVKKNYRFSFLYLSFLLTKTINLPLYFLISVYNFFFIYLFIHYYILYIHYINLGHNLSIS